MTSHPTAPRMGSIQRVLAHILVANIAVAVAKIALGLLTGSLSVLADGFSSVLDGASNVVGIAATGIAARPPDADHPYGHRRFETMATLGIGIFLLLAAWEIAKSALDRLTNTSELLTITPISFAVLIGTFIVNLIVVRYERFKAEQLSSPLLKADAEHTGIDLWVTASVMIGLVATRFGVAWADSAVALIVVALIVRTGFGILSDSFGILVDRTPLAPSQVGQLTQAVESVPGVDKITRLRSRGPADMIYTDVDVAVPYATTTEQAAAIADEIALRIKSTITGVEEVQVRFVPEHSTPPTTSQTVGALANALGLSVHEVAAVPSSNGRLLEMHVEVDPRLSLEEAHRKVTLLEDRVRDSVPALTDVITHIEPAAEDSGAVLQTRSASVLRDSALRIAKAVMPDADWHDATIRGVLGGYAVSMHCALPGTVSVQEAHQIAEDVETRIRAEIPTIQRVTIHTEPSESR